MRLKPEIKQFIKNNFHLIDKEEWRTFWGLVENDPGVIFNDLQDVKDLTEFLLDCGCDTLKGCKIIPEGYLCCSDRSYVNIPENIGYISYCAFAGMENLKQVVIPQRVEVVSDQAFSGCINLQEVTILNHDVMLERRTFRNCPKLLLIKYNGTKKQFESCFDNVAPLNEGCRVITTEGPIQL